ncbi:hypothetical protein CCACVL1_11721 [Corchorus capsularis]|uniref:Uncharacterized protein n=1 Tax=Corchorus capsularis TaxID=210143 RepID=A0A1R3IJV0_COCAP|nr:hypothetical protein CCACVL1_11721 [Corchorus capsularis]
MESGSPGYKTPRVAGFTEQSQTLTPCHTSAKLAGALWDRQP